MRTRSLGPVLLLAALPVLAVACSSDDDGDGGGSSADVSAVVAGEAFPEDRCAANEAAGTITFLTGFDFAATASIVDVIVADANGYYDDMCLDVEVQPGFSVPNYALVADGIAQFSSGGSFSELVEQAAAIETVFLATAVEGRSPIDGLILKPGTAAELADLEGATIGVKGRITTGVAAMLAQAGLHEGEQYQTVLLEGFDPIAHIAIESIVGFPGYKSNEPGTLERAGIDFDLFDPIDYDVPGSFGVIYTSGEWAEANPVALEDFMRATMRGLADALADPDAAVDAAMALVEASGNPMFLSEEGERFRWSTDAELIKSETAEGEGAAVPLADHLQDELDTYAEFGLFGNGDTPSAADHISDVLSRIYDGDGTVIWPG